MAISPRFLSDLRDRVTLSDIVGKRVALHRAGGQEFKGCCPFHQEKTPSFTLNDDKQFYHCFGCGAHGDVIGFVMQHDNLTFMEAVETLAATAGMEVPQQSREDVAQAKKQKDLYALLDDAARWFETRLYDPGNRDARHYMQERGVSDALMAQFRVGYAPNDGRSLRRHLKEEGYTDTQMIDAGVIRPSTRGGEPYAFFRERIIFPVTDRRGRIVAFGGRILPDHLRTPDRDGNKPPKYLNSSDSSLFHKGRMLFGESHARYAAGEGQDLIVVEGYLDVMACFSAGYRGAVAPLGTALTEEQIVILWKMIPAKEKNPVICFDGDNAGRRAAARACDRILPLLQPNQSALFAFLPEGQDPDSLIKVQGRQAFEKIIQNAIPLVDFLWSDLTGGQRFYTPESKAGLEIALEEVALKIADRTVQQYYRRTFKDRLYQAFRAQNLSFKGKNSKDKKGQKSPAMLVGRPVFAGDNMRYQILLATIINHPHIFDRIGESLGSLKIPNERLDLLRQTVLNILGRDAGLDTVALQDHLKDQGFESELGAVLSEALYTHAGFARPEADEEKILSGWQEIYGLMKKKTAENEYRSAVRALGQDCNKANEERMMALYTASQCE